MKTNFFKILFLIIFSVLINIQNSQIAFGQNCTDCSGSPIECEENEVLILPSDACKYCPSCVIAENGCTCQQDFSYTGAKCKKQKSFSPRCLPLNKPVCGCDGFTYTNSCYAKYAGVKNFTNGPCNNEITYNKGFTGVWKTKSNPFDVTGSITLRLCVPGDDLSGNFSVEKIINNITFLSSALTSYTNEELIFDFGATKPNFVSPIPPGGGGYVYTPKDFVRFDTKVKLLNPSTLELIFLSFNQSDIKLPLDQPIILNKESDFRECSSSYQQICCKGFTFSNVSSLFSSCPNNFNFTNCYRNNQCPFDSTVQPCENNRVDGCCP